MFENGLDKKKEDTIDTMPILHFDYNIGAMSTVDFERLFENNNNVSDESRITLPEPVTDRPIADNEILVKYCLKISNNLIINSEIHI